MYKLATHINICLLFEIQHYTDWGRKEVSLDKRKTWSGRHKPLKGLLKDRAMRSIKYSITKGKGFWENQCNYSSVIMTSKTINTCSLGKKEAWITVQQHLLPKREQKQFKATFLKIEQVEISKILTQHWNKLQGGWSPSLSFSVFSVPMGDSMVHEKHWWFQTFPHGLRENTA